MIIVNSPLMQNEMIEQLEGSTDPTFKFIKKEGIKLYFETSADNHEEAAKIAKQLIKEKVGNAIMFNVITQEYT